MTSEKIFDSLFISHPKLTQNRDEIFSAYRLLLEATKSNSLIMTCGNGGSAADSEHIVGELLKGFNLKRPLTQEAKQAFSQTENGDYIASSLQGAIRSISLVSQVGLISAFANDVDPALVFAQQVWAYAQCETDLLIALSTSGNSENVVNAAKTAKAKGIKVLSITGAKESRLSAISDVTIKLPASTPFEVQEFTLPVYHTLCAMVEADIWQS